MISQPNFPPRMRENKLLFFIIFPFLPFLDLVQSPNELAEFNFNSNGSKYVDWCKEKPFVCLNYYKVVVAFLESANINISHMQHTLAERTPWRHFRQQKTWFYRIRYMIDV